MQGVLRMNNITNDIFNCLSEQQKKLFLLWANVQCNVQCSCEEELREKIGDTKVDSLKHEYALHILKAR